MIALSSGTKPKAHKSHTNLTSTAKEVRRLDLASGRYAVNLATSRSEVEEALGLRYQVFNLELGQGLPESALTKRDEDEFDQYCDHLIVRDLESLKVVGTYRLQTAEMAQRGAGFYSDREFDLSKLPSAVLSDGIELGRACIAAEARNTRVLFLLWSGLAQYLVVREKRYLFGCCSMTGTSRELANASLDLLNERGYLSGRPLISPRSGMGGEETLPGLQFDPRHLPPLFRAYLKNGAKICSRPAIDRTFGTIDFLIVYDRRSGLGRFGQGEEI